MNLTAPLQAAASAAALLLLAASPAWTQAPPSPTTASGPSDPDRQSEALNAAVIAGNAEVDRRNAERARQAAEAEAAYQAQMAEWSARNAESKAQAEAWERTQAEWKAQMAACRADPWSSCHPPTLTKRSKR